jgi:hypothetical protein
MFGFRQSQLYFLNVVYYYYYIPTQYSAPTGHLQVDYIYIYTGYFLRSYFFYTGSVVLVLVINCIDISFLFWRFFPAAVSLYVVGMIAYYYCYIFNIKLLHYN